MLSDIIEKFSKIQPTDNAKNILKERYFWKNQNGEYVEKNWSDVSRRVARVTATAEILSSGDINNIKKWEETFYSVLNARLFIPNSPTLFNAGTGVREELLRKPIEEMMLQDYEEIYKTKNHLHMLSACFVVPVDDSIEGIFDAVKNYALITKVGGGVGSNFSSLRPKGTFVAGTSGRASGPVSFMHVFNSAIAVVEQGYKRRGALMGILDIDHPDI
jgi:ribonucleoside-diphosphate reductase alpha chain